MDWLIVRSLDWLIDWLIGGLIDWLIVRSLDRSIDWLMKILITFNRFSLGFAGVVFDLLVEKPEREDKLLEMMVNKLGDPEKKVASKACGYLVRLLLQHPNMKPVVVEEVERLLYRPNVSPKAQYYAVCFLVQIKLANSENALAVRLVKNLLFPLQGTEGVPRLWFSCFFTMLVFGLILLNFTLYLVQALDSIRINLQYLIHKYLHLTHELQSVPCDRSIDWLVVVRSVDWFDWLIDCSIDWLSDWLIECLIDWLIDWVFDRLIDWLIACVIWHLIYKYLYLF